MAGARGVLFEPEGNKVHSFAWILAKRTNNRAEWAAFLHGLEVMKELKIAACQVYGDSWIVIQKMRKLQENTKE